jgi:hypothetical protein
MPDPAVHAGPAQVYSPTEHVSMLAQPALVSSASPA